MQTRETTLGACEPVLAAALERLIRLDQETRPFVILQETNEPKRFVQFCTPLLPEHPRVLIDCPALCVVTVACPDVDDAVANALRLLWTQGVEDDETGLQLVEDKTDGGEGGLRNLARKLVPAF